MATVRQASSDDLELVFPLFTGFATHSQVKPEDWKKIFTPIWKDQPEEFGYVLEDRGEAVGFLGTLFSTRRVGGVPRRFCNLTSWIVRPEYRSESLSLLFPLLSRRDLTLTNYSASNRVIEILLKIGFHSLETHFQMVLPIPSPPRHIQVTFDLQEIQSKLAGVEKQIFQDHRSLHCTHVLIESVSDHCYLVLNPARKKNLPVMFVDYLGNPEFFRKTIGWCTYRICRSLGVYGLMVGEHSLGRGRLPFSLRVRRRHALLYRSRDVIPSEIDTLYSEIQVLGLKPV